MMANFWRALPRPIIGLSPMDGVTDAAFREIVAIHGNPDVMFTEFTHVGDLCHGARRGFDTLTYSPRQRPIVAQLYGKDPEMFYQAAHMICELGFDGLDINMGCPSKNVASSGSGAGLIRTPELALKIMDATRRGIQDWASGQSLEEAGVKRRTLATIDELQSATPSDHITARHRHTIPLSVKTRIGFDSVVIDEWSDCLVQGKPEVISIHGRTLKQMYRGSADWEAIQQAASRIRQLGILALGNGDIRSLTEAMERITTAQVDGVLIGRAALGNPWLFEQINTMRQAMREERALVFPSRAIALDAKFELMVQHAQCFEQLNGRERFPRMRKHLGWYCSGFPHAASMRADMVRASCTQDVTALLRQYRETHQGFSTSSPIAVPACSVSSWGC